MSRPKLISPMLDGFEMGDPISEHDGVCCCPAMRINSEDKYIVKIISVPASETKLDALLLTGAYPDRRAALAYFKELADGIADEKKILDNLAQLEGFISYEDCQIIPMDDGTGYDVYLLGKYRITLERESAVKPMTQLAAVNLGLDICAALAVCRRSGYLCVDLKPSNIFVVGDKEFRLGDLGFVRLNYLKYESLPDKYRSSYTAPEMSDIFATLSDTMDVYAAGLILYQVYNNGKLPFSGAQAPAEKFAAPAYADQEMAEIILKACDPDPAMRWKDPVQMGQAIVSYMQKNGVNDTPIVPETVDAPVVPETEIPAEETQDGVTVDATPDLPEEPTPAEEALTDIESIQEAIARQIELEDAVAEEAQPAEEAEAVEENQPVEEVAPMEDPALEIATAV